MSNTEILLLCAVVFMVGFDLGLMVANRLRDQIIDNYKDIIEEYRKSLVGSR
jgi:hypothetical protein